MKCSYLDCNNDAFPDNGLCPSHQIESTQLDRIEESILHVGTNIGSRLAAVEAKLGRIEKHQEVREMKEQRDLRCAHVDCTDQPTESSGWCAYHASNKGQSDRIETHLVYVKVTLVDIEQKLDKLLNTPSIYAKDRRSPVKQASED